jgi:Iron-containing redox enzyme
MFAAVIPGLRRAGFSPDEMNYFTLHVEQDEDHGRWLEEALARYATDDAARAQIRRGALASLEARGAFWTGVQQAVVRFRQPRSARLDGPRPRGVLHELLLTAWDGSRTGRLLEAQAERLRERRRPTMQDVLREAREGSP